MVGPAASPIVGLPVAGHNTSKRSVNFTIVWRAVAFIAKPKISVLPSDVTCFETREMPVVARAIANERELVLVPSPTVTCEPPVVV
ncbi:hypothetical protein D3C80_1786870 [compost metagenome]